MVLDFAEVPGVDTETAQYLKAQHFIGHASEDWPLKRKCIQAKSFNYEDVMTIQSV
jgi:hypothetical protein